MERSEIQMTRAKLPLSGILCFFMTGLIFVSLARERTRFFFAMPESSAPLK